MQALSKHSIAVVVPIFNEAPLLPELLKRLKAVFDASPAQQWSALLVDDGSTDASVMILRQQADQDARFQIIELSRNFGFQAALSAGLAQANTDAVITMDADLQDPPECIPALVAAWLEGADVVRAVRRSRQERGLRGLSLWLFHRFFRQLIDYPIEANTGTFGLLDRQVVLAMNRLPERHRFFPGIRAWVGFQTANILYDRQARPAGQAQDIVRLIRYALDGIFSFSYLPLRLLTWIGILVGTAGFFLGFYYVLKRLMNVEAAPMGFTTLVALVLFIGGIQLIGIGILGEYLARIYDEVKQRPLYVIKNPKVYP